MATRSITESIDDMTGAVVPSIEAVRWTWRGVPRVFDAGPETLARLKKGDDITLSDLLNASRKDTEAIKAPPRHVVRAKNRQVREWARSRGLEVSDKGRISQDLIDAYEAAHPSES